MSKEALLEFATRVRADEQMARRLVEAVGDRQAAAAEAAVAAFAQSQGFEVAPEDVAEMWRAASRAGPAEGELGDAELESVAGGYDGLFKGHSFGSWVRNGFPVDFPGMW